MKKKVIAVVLSLSLMAGSVPAWAMEMGGGGEEEAAVIEVVEDEGGAAVEADAPEAEPAAEEAEPEEAVIVEDAPVEVEAVETVEPAAEEAAPVSAEAEEVELGGTDEPAATADLTEEEKTAAVSAINDLTLNLKGAHFEFNITGDDLDGTKTVESEMEIPWDPADPDEPGWNNNLLTITKTGGAVLSRENYSVYYENTNKVTDDAYLHITFKGIGDDKALKGTVKVKFAITTRSLADDAQLKVTSYAMESDAKDHTADGTVDGNWHYTYDGKAHGVASFTVTDNGVELKKDTDYTIDDYDKVVAGTKEVKIKSAEKSNYVGTSACLITYRIDPRDAEKDGGIETPDVTILANSAEYNETSDANTREQKLFMPNIKDTLANEGKGAALSNYMVSYYAIKNGEPDITGGDKKAEVFGDHSNDKENSEYFYYVRPLVGGNYKAVAGNSPELQGKVKIVVVDEAKTLADAYELIKDKIDGKNYVYDGKDKFTDVETEVKNAFASLNKDFDDRITVKTVKIVDVKDSYEVVTTGNSAIDGWKSTDSVTVHVNVKQADIAKGTGVKDPWNDNLSGDIEAVQGINQDASKKYVNQVPVITSTLAWDPECGPKRAGIALKEGVDYEIVIPESTAANGRITEITVKGLGNFKSEKKISVGEDEKIKLSRLGDSDIAVETAADGTVTKVEVRDKAGDVIPNTDNVNYTVKADCGCNNDKHVAGKVHVLVITATGTGICEGSCTKKFWLTDEKFEDAYQANSSITNPQVDKAVATAPYKQVTISPKANPGTFTAAEAVCDGYYVWMDDPQTDEAKKLTISVTDFATEGIKNYRVSGNDVQPMTFPEVGQWKLVLTPKVDFENGRYTGKLEVPFEVKVKEFKKDNITVTPKSEGIVWPGKPATEADLAKGLVVTDTSNASGALTLVYDKDYVITAMADADLIGEATVTLSGKDGSKYDSQTMTAKVMINARNLADAKLTLAEGALDYTGKEFTTLPSELIKVTFDDGKTVVDPSEYDVTVTSTGSIVNSNVTVTVQAKEIRKGFHYEGSQSTTGKITKADISHKDVFKLEGVESPQYLYDPETGAVQTGLKLIDIRTNDEISICEESKYEYVDNKKAGTAKVLVTAADTTNYTGKAEAEFQVLIPSAANVYLKQEVYTYTGEEIEPEVDKVTAANGTEISSDSWKVKNYVDNKDAGRGTVVVEVTVNGESMEIRKDFTIEPAKITAADVSDPAATQAYTGDVVRPAVTVTVNGKTLKVGTDYIVMNTESKEVGRKDLAVHGIGNYAGDVLKKFEVVAASVNNAKIGGLKASYAYNGAVRKPAVTVTLGEKVLKKGTDYKVAYTNNANVGAKTVKVTGIGNYTGSVKTTFTVVPKKAVISKVTAGAKQITVAAEAQSGAKYHIQYREAGTKKWTGVVTKNATQAIKNLKSGTNYIVRVRAYKVIQGKKVLGTWSTAKATAKVK